MFKWRRFCRKEDLVVHVLSRQLPCLSQGTHDLEAKRFPINMRGIPTRLIWVGSKDETQVRKLWFIMISRGKSIAWGWFRALHGFTALSFCWGCLSALSKGDTGRSTSNLKRWVGKIVSCDVDTQQLMFLRNNLGFTHCGWLFFWGEMSQNHSQTFNYRGNWQIDSALLAGDPFLLQADFLRQFQSAQWDISSFDLRISSFFLRLPCKRNTNCLLKSRFWGKFHLNSF